MYHYCHEVFFHLFCSFWTKSIQLGTEVHCKVEMWRCGFSLPLLSYLRQNFLGHRHIWRRHICCGSGLVRLHHINVQWHSLTWSRGLEEVRRMHLPLNFLLSAGGREGQDEGKIFLCVGVRTRSFWALRKTKKVSKNGLQQNQIEAQQFSKKQIYSHPHFILFFSAHFRPHNQKRNGSKLLKDLKNDETTLTASVHLMANISRLEHHLERDPPFLIINISTA